MIGSRFGPYLITAELGHGGMGEVYRATDSKLKREVALKVLSGTFAADKDGLARFEREAQLLAQLHHPNIASIFGLEESAGVRALVMELVEGPTLAERLEAGALPVDECLAIALQISEALEEAHEKGIVHRDLKPQNIKAPRQGKVKLLDFGLAKATHAHVGLGSPNEMADSPTVAFGDTREGVILGTVAYMAPEQARGGAIDKRADIWAFGVVLYEMVAGERLFAEGSIVDTLSAVMRKPIDLGALPPQTPPSVRRLLARCLERDPRRRLRDIGEARLVIEEAGSGSGGDDSSAAEVPGSVPHRRVRRRAAIALALLAGGAVLGAAAVSWLRRPSAPEPIRIHPLTFSGTDSDPAASTDGKLIAFTSRRDDASRIWIKQLAGGGEAPLTTGPDGLARFSPDGANLLFVRDLGSTQAIYRIGLVGGEPRRLVDGATAADWSSDGKSIVFVRNAAGGAKGSQIGVLDVASGQERILGNLGGRLLHSPRWSPDGHLIAFASGSWAAADWRLETIDLAGHIAAIPPGDPGTAMGGLAWSGSGHTIFFVQAPAVTGDMMGAGSRVIRCDVRSGERRTLFWGNGLSWMASAVGEISQTDVLAPGRLIFGQRLRRQNLREVDLGASDAVPVSRLLAQGSSIDRQPTYSPDGRQILFSSNRSGSLDLWTIERSSGAVRRVTDDSAQDWDPAYMPDGRHILWDSDRGSGHFEVWIANIDGSDARQVTRDGVSAQNPTATPDGKWIVYWSGNAEKGGIWKIHPDGSAATLLRRANAAETEVSPDGRYLLYDDQDRLNLRTTIGVLEVDTGRVVPFTIVVRYRLGSPAIIWGRARWSRDGKTIYFVGENEQGLSGVYAQDFAPGRDTTSTRRPAAGFSSEYVTESLGLSPDGSHLTLSTGQESASIMVADGVAGALPPARNAP